MNNRLRNLVTIASLTSLLVLGCNRGCGSEQDEVSGDTEPGLDVETASETRSDEIGQVDESDAESEPQSSSEDSTDGQNERTAGDEESDFLQRTRPSGPSPTNSSNGATADSLAFNTRIMLGGEPIPPPFIADLMTRSDLRSVFGFRGELHESDLAGKNLSASYHAIRFAPEDDAFGFSIELWRVAEAPDATQMVRGMRDSWFSGENAESLPNAAIGESMGIRSLVIGSPRERFVTLLSCSSDLCTSEQLLAMGAISKNRIETND